MDMLREQLHAQEQRAARAELSLLTMSELQVNSVTVQANQGLQWTRFCLVLHKQAATFDGRLEQSVLA